MKKVNYFVVQDYENEKFNLLLVHTQHLSESNVSALIYHVKATISDYTISDLITEFEKYDTKATILAFKTVYF